MYYLDNNYFKTEKSTRHVRGLYNGRYSLLFPPLGWGGGWSLTTLVDQMSLRCHLSLLGKMGLWEACLCFSFLSWLEMATSYVVEVTQLKFIFEARRTTQNFFFFLSFFGG